MIACKFGRQLLVILNMAADDQLSGNSRFNAIRQHDPNVTHRIAFNFHALDRGVNFEEAIVAIGF